MTNSRYARAPVLAGGQYYGTSYLIPTIRKAVANGDILCDEIVLSGRERLDIVAGKYLGDSSLFWVIAACSNIGWSLQVPPGVVLKIPRLSDLQRYL